MARDLAARPPSAEDARPGAPRARELMVATAVAAAVLAALSVRNQTVVSVPLHDLMVRDGSLGISVVAAA